jgi:hypothetical protein
MKNKLLALLASLTLFLSFAIAASAPTYTASPDTLWRAQGDPVFKADGSLATLVVPFFYKATFTNTTDPTDHFDKNLGQVDVDFVKDAAKTVTVNGKTYTYAEVGAAFVAIGNNEWAKP